MRAHASGSASALKRAVDMQPCRSHAQRPGCTLAAGPALLDLRGMEEMVCVCVCVCVCV